ncbi:unnamed protein product [Bemisia tabaci]|uniref:Ketoreductase domain-containing protein n=1 Tax=Bemisia tabaci TaxID=7038 RepID=A0A9P0EYX8_BEMTA|nr:unnamed protein product [Bemisia tabaci]
MGVFEWIGLGYVSYLFLYAVFLCLSDCDLGLLLATKFGKGIGKFNKKVVWITGASSGIGEHLALVLAKAGAKLVLSARSETNLERVKQKCLGADGITSEDILIIPMDVTDFSQHQQHFNKVLSHFGQLDILVNNAGRSQRASWEDIQLDVDKQMFDLNVFGTISLSRIAARYFLDRGSGHIAVTSSIAGVLGAPFSGSYTATKHAIHGYFNSLRREKLGTNLVITLLCPGPTFSNFLAESFTDKPGEKFGQPQSATDRRMTTERCAYLSAIAIANELNEVWMGLFPLLPLVYIAVYCPVITNSLGRFVGASALQKLRDTKVAVDESKRNDASS